MEMLKRWQVVKMNIDSELAIIELFMNIIKITAQKLRIINIKISTGRGFRKLGNILRFFDRCNNFDIFHSLIIKLDTC